MQGRRHRPKCIYRDNSNFTSRYCCLFHYDHTLLTIELLQQHTDHHFSHHHYHHDLIYRLRQFLSQLLKPSTIVIILSFVISLVDPLKALFIPPSSTFQPHFRPVGPDGQPLLAFISDAATFIDGACIPLRLISLGNAIASLSLRSGEPFPKCAIALLALVRWPSFL